VLATTHHAPIIEIGSSQSLRRQGRIGCARNSGDQIVNIPVEPGQRTATSSLAELVQLAGLPASAVDSVEITGAGDPVLPTRYNPVAPGSEVMAATGLAAAELWALKTGKRQRVRLDTRAAAAALRSPKFVMINGRKPEEDPERITGFYPLRDGRWMYLHCNFFNLRERNIALLGASPNRDSVAQAVATREGLELEQALFDGGG